MSEYRLDMDRYASLARQAQAEGCVLLENKNKALPLRTADKVAVFGRIAFNYYKSGLGSGGLVNTRYVVGILDALKKASSIHIDQELLDIYESWIKQNPFDEGEGWGKVPWSQKEMPVTEEMLERAKRADAAVIIIGRTAGEDQDNRASEGAYLLSETERDLIQKVSACNSRTIVVLNVGNIIDMKWVKEYQPAAVLYAWQGGQEGGNGVADILTGTITPCGKLSDTIAYDITDYPSTNNFGDPKRNLYEEDIYVGYRYFETFAKDKVLYPFGYGLSYTTFRIDSILQTSENGIQITANVTNTGDVSGKEVIQVYVKVPTGKLGQPARKLVAYAKTKTLNPGEKQQLTLEFSDYRYASYDDSGITGVRSAYILEAGTYEFYTGSDVRTASFTGSCTHPFTVIEQLQEASAPVVPYRRIKALETPDGYTLRTEDTPLRTIDIRKRMESERKEPLPYTGDRGFKLIDVLDGKVSMNDFISQLSDASMIHMFRGEGMCSPKVTAGTAGAFGGITDELLSFGIPVACCSDGPSGIRMDCGAIAFSMPNGTLLGCTFNDELIEALYEMEGQELRKNKIDSLLGPGMNIHRNPLNGRNFEYISEDPLLTGKISAAQIRSMSKYGIGSTIKHFCGNNQEYSRRFADSVISERALREIYLKGFEIAVKEGKARAVMTTYGPVNGLWTSGNYDLCTTILRNEWKFDGIVMTDWWAEANYPGQPSHKKVKAPMAAAQNDIYMLAPGNNETNPEGDDMDEALLDGRITRYDLQRNTANILNYLLKSPALLHLADRIDPKELEEMNRSEEDTFSAANLQYFSADGNDEVVIDGSFLSPRAGKSDTFGLAIRNHCMYEIQFVLKSDLHALAQLPVSVYADNVLKAMISIQGTDGRTIKQTADLDVLRGNIHFLKLFYGANGLQIKKIIIRPKNS